MARKVKFKEEDWNKYLDKEFEVSALSQGTTEPSVSDIFLLRATENLGLDVPNEEVFYSTKPERYIIGLAISYSYNKFYERMRKRITRCKTDKITVFGIEYDMKKLKEDLEYNRDLAVNQQRLAISYYSSSDKYLPKFDIQVILRDTPLKRILDEKFRLEMRIDNSYADGGLDAVRQLIIEEVQDEQVKEELLLIIDTYLASSLDRLDRYIKENSIDTSDYVAEGEMTREEIEEWVRKYVPKDIY